MRRIFAFVLVVLLGVAFAMPLAVPAFAKSKGSFFEMFLSKKSKTTQPAPAVQKPAAKKKSKKKVRKKKKRIKAKKKKSGSAAAAVVIKALDKNEGASRLYVFGDGMASNLVGGLERIYAKDPNLLVVNAAKGSSGFVRDDFYDWNAAIKEYIAKGDIGVAVISIGVNDRQPLRINGSERKALSDVWKVEYRARLTQFLTALRVANVPVVWVGLPPMRAKGYSNAMSQIASMHRNAAFSGKAEFVDIFERFIDESGQFTSYGPNLKGENVTMRSKDGIFFTRAGNDKVAFFIEKAVKKFYVGGTLSVAIADPLAGTVSANMVRPPYQGLGQGRLLEVAGAIVALDAPRRDAGELVRARQSSLPAFDLDSLMEVPAGRADGFYPIKVEDAAQNVDVPALDIPNSPKNEQQVSQLP